MHIKIFFFLAIFILSINFSAALEGDLNQDDAVNIADILLIVNDFGKTSGFNPAVDLAPPSGEINIFDVMVVVRNWEALPINTTNPLVVVLNSNSIETTGKTHRITLSNVASGNSIVIGLSQSDSANVFYTVSDSQGNTYGSAARKFSPNGRLSEIFLSSNILGASVLNITITSNGNIDLVISAIEVSGVSGVDINGSNYETNNMNSHSCAEPGINTSSNVFIFCVGSLNGPAGLLTEGNGYTKLGSYSQAMFQYRISQSSLLGETGRWTSNSERFASMAFASFKMGGSIPPPIVTPSPDPSPDPLLNPGPFTLPKPAPKDEGPLHAYYNSLLALPELHTAQSFRSQSELDWLVYDSCKACAPSDSITYNFAGDTYPQKQDAAKVLMPGGGSGSVIEWINVPISITGGNALIIWDGWWGREYITGGLDAHKAFQITNHREQVFFETQTHFGGRSEFPVAVRPYGALQPGTWEGYLERLEPLLGGGGSGGKIYPFKIQPETWTRFIVFYESVSGGVDKWSMWVLDENRAALQLYDQIPYEAPNDTLKSFWLEYNTSQEAAVIQALTAYVRNLVVLRNITDPTIFLQRPIGGMNE